MRVHRSIRVPMLTGHREHVDGVHCFTRAKVAQALLTLDYVHADSNWADWADVLIKVVPCLILELI